MRRLLSALILLAGCQSLGEPPPELRDRLEVVATSGVRRIARVRIESSWFSGEFKAIVLERSGPDPAVRLQLLPDVGGKVLDLVAHPDAVVANWPHRGEVLREREALTGFLAITLMETATPIDWSRIRSGRREGESFLVELEPASRGLDLTVRAELDEDGALSARHYELDGIGWTEQFGPEHVIRSRDFEWRFLEESAESIPRPSDRVFEMRVDS